MRRAHPDRLLVLCTVLFMIIAAISFAVFTTAEQACANMQNCIPTTKPSGEMLWDRFSHHFISLMK